VKAIKCRLESGLHQCKCFSLSPARYYSAIKRYYFIAPETVKYIEVLPLINIMPEAYTEGIEIRLHTDESVCSATHSGQLNTIEIFTFQQGPSNDNISTVNMNFNYKYRLWLMLTFL
jgi:hypothetical protein